MLLVLWEEIIKIHKINQLLNHQPQMLLVLWEEINKNHKIQNHLTHLTLWEINNL